MNKNAIVEQDIKEIISNGFNFNGKIIFITGATGLIGSMLVQTLIDSDESIQILALARSRQRLEELFSNEIKSGRITPIYQDIVKEINYDGKVDYIIHTACGTASTDFMEHPVETIDTIVNGTKNILKFAEQKQVQSVVHLSSMEVYGETDFNRELPLKEEDLGYLNPKNIRNCYPQGKRLAETLCVSFAQEYNVPVKIARLAQIIASNANPQDKRVVTYFANCCAAKSSITLQSPGLSSRNFCYITDCISAILTILLNGENGEIYNVSNPHAFSSILDLAKFLTEKYHLSPINFNLDKTGKYPPPGKLKLDSTRLEALGWNAKVNTEEMFERVITGLLF